MPIEVTEQYIRIRQKEPGQFDRMRTIVLSKEQGIHAIVGFKSGQEGSVIQAYLFEKDKWTLAQAQEWIAAHKGDSLYDFVLLEKIKLLDADALLMKKIKSLPIEKKNVELTDSLVVDEWIEREDGLLLKNVVFAKEIVQPYSDGMHYKPASELKAALDSARGKPIVGFAHPPEKVVTSMKQQSGYVVFDTVNWDEKNNRMYGDVLIKKEPKNKLLIDEVKKGKLQDCSIGFRCDIVKQSGEFQGKHYDFVQKNLFIDHIAFVYQGRAGHEDGVGVNAF